MKIREKEKEKRKKPLLSVAELPILLGGILIIIGTFLDWFSYVCADKVVRISGIELGKDVGVYPEIFLLPFIGIFLIGGALFSARRRNSTHPLDIHRGVPLALAVAVGVVAIAIPFEVTIRHSAYLEKVELGKVEGGLSFWNNLDIGWFVCVFGVMLAYIGVMLACFKMLRVTGVSDFALHRTDMEEKPAPLPPSPPYPPPGFLPPPPLPMQPPQPSTPLQPAKR